MDSDIRCPTRHIFAAVAPRLISEAVDSQLRRSFRSFFTQFARDAFTDDDDLKNKRLSDFSWREDEIDTCIVQLRALGLVEESRRKRSVRDTSTYWSLTKFGDHQMVVLRALRKTQAPARKAGAKAPKLSEDEEDE